eukprot:4939106-Alexandrium_andersonii.AAC.1
MQEWAIASKTSRASICATARPVFELRTLLSDELGREQELPSLSARPESELARINPLNSRQAERAEALFLQPLSRAEKTYRPELANAPRA